MDRVRVNGVDLEYVEAGSGTPVVFSHGGSSDVRYWEPQREAFATKHRFVAYSRRFHGLGPRPATDDESASAHADDLLGLIRRVGPGPVHVVGFSAAVALRAALREPGLVRSLTIVEPNVPWLLSGHPDGEAALEWWRSENERVRSEAGDDLERRAKLWFELVNNRGPGTFDAQPEGLRRMWLDNFDTSRPASRPPDPLTCDQLTALPMPTLILGAEFGMPYSRRIVEVLATCIPKGRFVVVPAVTHFMSYQEPAAFNALVLEFISEH